MLTTTKTKPKHCRWNDLFANKFKLEKNKAGTGMRKIEDKPIKGEGLKEGRAIFFLYPIASRFAQVYDGAALRAQTHILHPNLY